MFFAKINVKNDYEKRGDLVFRPLSRIYKKIGAGYNTSDNVVPLVGIVSNNVFYEFTTWKKIEDVKYEIISVDEFETILNNLKIENLKKLREMINYIIFNEQSKNDYGISSIEDLANDRWIDFDGYNNSLTNVNPYLEPLNSYNDFIYKCKMQKIMKENDAYGRKI